MYSDSVNEIDKIAEAAAKIADARAVIDRETPIRDKQIVAARRAGYRWNKISQAARLTRSGTVFAAQNANDGVIPVPRTQE